MGRVKHGSLVVAIASTLLFPACSVHHAPVVDPSCTQGLAILGSAESEEEMQEARSLFQTSCELGHGAGCFHLALMWERGIGGMEDQELSLLLLQRSCDLGESQGCSLFNARMKMLEWETGWDTGMSVFWP